MTASPTYAVEKWTVEDAEKALGKNKVNRKLREGHVDRYRRDMEAGNWYVGIPIMFDSEGNLINGQHRLNAQIQANVDVEYLVVRQLLPESQKVIDTGATRTFADILGFSGEKYYGMLAPVIRMVTLLKAGKLSTGRYYPSVQEMMQVLEDHPELKHSVELVSTYRLAKMTQYNDTVMAVAHWMIAQANSFEEADHFVYRVVHLTGERPGSPVLALAKRINEIRRTGLSVKTPALLALVLKAWNYDAEGKTVKKLATFPKGEFTIPEVKTRSVAYRPFDPDEDDQFAEVEDQSGEAG